MRAAVASSVRRQVFGGEEMARYLMAVLLFAIFVREACCRSCTAAGKGGERCMCVSRQVICDGVESETVLITVRTIKSSRGFTVLIYNVDMSDAELGEVAEAVGRRGEVVVDGSVYNAATFAATTARPRTTTTTTTTTVTTTVTRTTAANAASDNARGGNARGDSPPNAAAEEEGESGSGGSDDDDEQPESDDGGIDADDAALTAVGVTSAVFIGCVIAYCVCKRRCSGRSVSEAVVSVLVSRKQTKKVILLREFFSPHQIR